MPLLKRNNSISEQLTALTKLPGQIKRARRSSKTAKLIAKAVEIRKKPLGKFETRIEKLLGINRIPGIRRGAFESKEKFEKRADRERGVVIGLKRRIREKLTKRRQEQVGALTKKSRKLSLR